MLFMARIAAGVLPASPLASRGYRTGRFTQKMGRRHTKGRGAKSFGFLTSKGARSPCAAPPLARQTAALRSVALRFSQ